MALPLAYSFDCGKIEDAGLCEDIMSSGLSETDKDALIVSMLSESDLPEHDFVKAWNTRLPFVEAPDGVETKSAGYVYGAWMKIVAVMPSVSEDGTLYSNGKGEIQVAYNYKVSRPRYYLDCRTDYVDRQLEANLNVYANGRLIGSGKLVGFESYEDTSFRAELVIRHNVEVRHYRYTYEDGRKVCRYSRSDYAGSSVALEDKQDTKYYPGKVSGGITDLKGYYGTTEGRIDALGITGFRLDFKDSRYWLSDYSYGLDYGLKPYYALTVTAGPSESKGIRNMLVDGNIFKVRDTSDCNLTLYSHFDVIQQKCVFNLEEMPEIRLDVSQPYNLHNWNIVWSLLVLSGIIFIVYKLTRSIGEKHG
ncbi:MAG: hypothetical protein V1906_00050 [Candidatus Woesearchaeota archaeon]